ncbi:hypothetical protein JRQ81_008112 [Phrynocephalus forsythii]|uniref:Uncharacterized protein n=1 Tax=Phrynocephalus forsythii TaxID=171643 RepID=A0A9Q0XEN2_9SAUR|nr:hypothetical protein JRQ81_008112 [Phrynocephalus forsythii]
MSRGKHCGFRSGIGSENQPDEEEENGFVGLNSHASSVATHRGYARRLRGASFMAFVRSTETGVGHSILPVSVVPESCYSYLPNLQNPNIPIAQVPAGTELSQGSTRKVGS